ncbi:MAG: ABC transporter permease subunit [Eubacteriales bacterium]
MNVYKHELKVYTKNTIIWIFSMSSIAALMMSFYPIIKNDMDNFMQLMDNFPPAMKSIIGLTLDNFSSALGFYCFAFTYTMLFGAIQAMNLGVGILSKEERDKTADFLMTKPISRIKILTSKVLSAITIFVVTNIIYTIVTAILLQIMSEGSYDFSKFVLINASLFFSQIILFSIGLIISIVVKKVKAVLPISLGLVFGFFAISAFAVTASDDKLRYLSPFQYFETNYILLQGKYEANYVIFGFVIVLICTVLSYILYKRKNIQAV